MLLVWRVLKSLLQATVTTPEDRIIPIIVQFLIDEEKPSSTSGHLGHPSS